MFCRPDLLLRGASADLRVTSSNLTRHNTVNIESWISQRNPPVTDIILLCRRCFLFFFFLVANCIKICTCVPVSWFSIFYPLLSWNRNPRKSLFLMIFPSQTSFLFLFWHRWSGPYLPPRVSVSITLTDDILFINLCAKRDPRLVCHLILFSLSVPVPQPFPRSFFQNVFICLNTLFFLFRTMLYSPSKPLLFFLCPFCLCNSLNDTQQHTMLNYYLP